MAGRGKGNLTGVVARQVMRLPCKQVYAGALPADSTNFTAKGRASQVCPAEGCSARDQTRARIGPFHRGENEIQASLISSAFVGATPTPATNFGRCSPQPTVNRPSLKKSGKLTSG